MNSGDVIDRESVDSVLDWLGETPTVKLKSVPPCEPWPSDDEVTEEMPVWVTGPLVERAKQR